VRLVLRQDVSGVGRRGDIVDVAKGFARNYLLPTGRAIESSSRMEAQAAAMRRARDLRETQEKESAANVAALIGSSRLTITARAGTQGRLFGSVTAADVAEALAAQTGAVVDRRRIELDEPIKSLGTHVVTVKLHPEVSAEVTLEVVPA
jgi:large subunit ribosomal protein L9